jgi:Tfp pilus assembly ATPase PilU
MNRNGTVKVHQKIGNYTEMGFPFYLESGDLFGSSLSILGNQTLNNESVVFLTVGMYRNHNRANHIKSTEETILLLVSHSCFLVCSLLCLFQGLRERMEVWEQYTLSY